MNKFIKIAQNARAEMHDIQNQIDSNDKTLGNQMTVLALATTLMTLGTMITAYEYVRQKKAATNARAAHHNTRGK